MNNKRTRKAAPRAARREDPLRECALAGARLMAATAAVFQGPVFDHFRKAGVEVLLGFRAVIDAEIDWLERTPKKGTRVAVE